jgi:hypothetical protein
MTNGAPEYYARSDVVFVAPVGAFGWQEVTAGDDHGS